MNHDSPRDAMPPPPLAAALNEIEFAQLIRRSDENDGASALPVYLFKHALVQESIYAAMMRHERKRLHRLVAEALERAYPERNKELAGQLAAHFEEAGELTRALYYYERAAQDAVDRFANREALEFYRHALDAAEELQTDTRDTLYRARGLVHERIGEFTDAVADLELALGFARGTDDGVAEWQSLIDLGFAWLARDYARAGKYLEEALALARGTNDAARIAQSLNRVGNWYLNNEDLSRALSYHHEALSIFASLNDERGVADTHDLLGMSGLVGSNFPDGISHLEKAIGLYRKLGDRRGETASLTTRFLQHPSLQTDTILTVPAAQTTEEDMAQLLTLTQELGWRAGEAFVLFLGGENMAGEGAYGRGLELEARAMALAREIDHRQWLAASIIIYGAIHADIFAFGTAETYLHQGLEIAEEIGSLYWTRTATAILASTLVAQNRLAPAQELLDRAVPEGSPAVTSGQRLSWLARVELALAQHAPERALAALNHMISQTPNLPSERVIPRLAILKAIALLQLDRHEQAEPVAQAARAELVAHPQPRLLWRAQGALSRIYRAQGRTTEAAAAGHAAQALVATLANTVKEASLREQFVTHAAEWIQGN